MVRVISARQRWLVMGLLLIAGVCWARGAGLSSRVVQDQPALLYLPFQDEAVETCPSLADDQGAHSPLPAIECLEDKGLEDKGLEDKGLEDQGIEDQGIAVRSSFQPPASVDNMLTDPPLPRNETQVARDEMLQELVRLRTMIGSPWSGPDNVSEFARAVSQIPATNLDSSLVPDNVPPPLRAVESLEGQQLGEASVGPSSAKSTLSTPTSNLFYAAHELDQRAYQLLERGDFPAADAHRSLATRIWTLLREVEALSP